jgi:hypothetical protein
VLVWLHVCMGMKVHFKTKAVMFMKLESELLLVKDWSAA